MRLSIRDGHRCAVSIVPNARLLAGLQKRGLLRDGFIADVVVFDPRSVGSPATRSEPKQLPTGIDYVWVNGTLVVDQGVHTGALAGRALRRGRA